MAAPLVVSFWVRAGFTLVDRFYAASIDLADASQAAIGLTMPFEFLMIACWVGTSNGLTARVAAAMGAREGRKIEQLVRATRRIVHGLVALFLLLAAGIWLGTPHAGLAPDVAQQFRVYASVLLAGSAFTSFWSILPDSLVKAHHDTRSTMWAGLLSGGTNVVLNTVFVFVFHWGILGIALSTVIGRLAGLFYALGRAAHHERLRVERGEDTAPGVFEHPLRAIGVLAFPASITFVVLSLESLAINGIVVRLEPSTASLAAWSVFDGLVRFLTMPPIAVGVALLPLTARLWGSRDCDQIRLELRVALRATALYALVLVLPGSLLFGERLAEWLTDGAEAQRYAALGMAWMPAAVLAAAPLFLYRSSFEGMQRPRPGMVIGIVRAALLVVPLTWVGAHLAPEVGQPQIAGAYAGFVTGAALATGILALWVRRTLTREALAAAA